LAAPQPGHAGIGRSVEMLAVARLGT
jgi:hypothetical protein